MSLAKFAVLFDSPVYWAGQTITGRVLVKFTGPTIIKSIYLKYCGGGSVSWTEWQGDNSQTYSSSESYLRLQQLVFGNQTEESELAAGEYVYVFHTQLPTDLPCSYRGKYGSVKYSVEAILDRPWKLNEVRKQWITVLSVFDLNHIPDAAEPVSERIVKSFWGQSESLILRAELPVRGFVPGQIIPIKVTMHNGSNVQVTILVASLHQTVVFKADGSINTSTSCILQDVLSIAKGCKDIENLFKLRVPSLPPSNLEFCKIMTTTYHLHVEAKVGGMHKNAKIDTVIIIGNVPLMAYEKPTNQSLHNPGNFWFPLESYGYSSPPTYVVDMKLGDSKEKKNYPFYPVYNF